MLATAVSQIFEQNDAIETRRTDTGVGIGRTCQRLTCRLCAAKMLLKSLVKGDDAAANQIKRVELPGYEGRLKFTQTTEGLTVELPADQTPLKSYRPERWS